MLPQPVFDIAPPLHIVKAIFCNVWKASTVEPLIVPTWKMFQNLQTCWDDLSVSDNSQLYLRLKGSTSDLVQALIAARHSRKIQDDVKEFINLTLFQIRKKLYDLLARGIQSCQMDVKKVYTKVVSKGIKEKQKTLMPFSLIKWSALPNIVSLKTFALWCI